MVKKVKVARRQMGAHGFTLIEMIAVVGILLILILALLPRMEANRRSANDQVVANYLREIQKYQELYYGFNRTYANSLSELQSLRPPLESPPTNPPVSVTHFQGDSSTYCVIAQTSAGMYPYKATPKGIEPVTSGSGSCP